MTCTQTDTDKVVEDILKATGAWQEGHFLLTSGKHSNQYMQCQILLQYPRLGNYLADLLISKLLHQGILPEVVVGPAMGAIHWEVFVAQSLERCLLQNPDLRNSSNRESDHHTLSTSASGQEYFLTHDTINDAIAGTRLPDFIKAVFAEKIVGTSDFELRRGIELNPGQKVLVVEDVTTTGGSVRRVLDLLNSLRCDPVAVGAIVDRSGSRISYDAPFVKLLTVDLATYDKKECPMCKAGSQVIKPGSSTI